MSTYTTRNEAITYEIENAIEAGGAATAEEFDIEAIADAVLGGYEDGYAVMVTEDDFWGTVAQNARA